MAETRRSTVKAPSPREREALEIARNASAVQSVGCVLIDTLIAKVQIS